MLTRKFLYVTVLTLTFLTGCQNNSSSNDLNKALLDVQSEYDDLTNEINKQDTKIIIHSEKNIYTLPIKKLMVTLENNGKNSVWYGKPVYLEKLQGGSWFHIPYKDNFAFTFEALNLKPGDSFAQEIALNYLDYDLTKGQYRIRKSIQVGTEEFMIADEFEIRSE